MSGCEEIRDLLPLMAVEELSIEGSLSVAEHLDECNACKTELQDYRAICAVARDDLVEVPPAPRPAKTVPIAGRWLAVAAALLLVGVFLGRMSVWMVVPAGLPSTATETAQDTFERGAGVDPVAGANDVPHSTGSGLTRPQHRGTLSVFSTQARAHLSAADGRLF